MHPVMNSIRKDIEVIAAPGRGGATQARALKPLPINVRPYDNEYAWKGNVYQLDGWLKPIVTAMQFACDDPKVAWFCDTTARTYLTLDGGQSWQNVSNQMMGAAVQNLAASPSRTFVLYAQDERRRAPHARRGTELAGRACGKSPHVHRIRLQAAADAGFGRHAANQRV